MKVPEIMKKVEIINQGENYSLSTTNTKTPKLRNGEVLLKVFSSGLNRADIFQSEGKYPPPLGASDILGLEVSGEVIKKSPDVHTLEIGDKVCALLSGGGYAEYVNTNAELCFHIPDHIDKLYASALPEAIFTIWYNIFQIGDLKENETILIHGGSSGVGTMGIQIAKLFKNKIIVTAGTDEKCRACIDLGADEAINYNKNDFLSHLQSNRSKTRVDVILDMVGGDYVEKNIKLLKHNGRLVFIAFNKGSRVNLNLLKIMTKKLVITGSTLRSQSLEKKIEIAQSIRKNLWPLVKSGSIKPVVDSTYPFYKAMNAHDRMKSGEHIGKILLINK